MKKLIVPLAIFSFLLPQVTDAAWWNPFSWFKRQNIETAAPATRAVPAMPATEARGTGTQAQPASPAQRAVPAVPASPSTGAVPTRTITDRAEASEALKAAKATWLSYIKANRTKLAEPVYNATAIQIFTAFDQAFSTSYASGFKALKAQAEVTAFVDAFLTKEDK